MEPSGRRGTVTMADVATYAGVSRALVSIVFRDAPGASAATRERVLRAAAELGYRPDRRASLLGSSRSRTIGVAFGLQHEFHGELVEHLYAASDPAGYDLALGAWAPSRSEETAVSSLLEFRCESLVLVGSMLSRPALQTLTDRIPVVAVARALSGVGPDVVRTDDAAGAALAVEHLRALGHRSIAHLDGGRAPGAAERRSGYLRAMTAGGLRQTARVVRGGLTDADGAQALPALLRAPAPTAVLAFNDHCAAGVVAAAREAGIDVPGDLSVVGYDDTRVAALPTLALTTVAQDGEGLATRAWARAVARAEGDPTGPLSSVVAPRLVVRKTAAPASGR